MIASRTKGRSGKEKVYLLFLSVISVNKTLMAKIRQDVWNQ